MFLILVRDCEEQGMASDVIRVVVATAGVWSAHQLQTAVGALDGLVCRLAAASLIAEVASRYEAQFANWRAFGLLTRRPSNWGDSTAGTEALARNDFLEFATALRRHGIILKPTEMSWELEFSVGDLLELVPVRRRLEVEFLELGSPGLMSFLLSGFKEDSKFCDVFLHLINHLFHYKEMRQLMKVARQYAKAHALAERGRAEQELAKARLYHLRVLREEQSLQRVSGPAGIQVDSDTKIQEQNQVLIQAGILPSDIKRLLLEPNEQDVSVLCRLKCEGLLIGIGLEGVAGRKER